eukprot:SAG31_NODE_55_length_29938_cov_9.154027_40_plen_89_part_00
MLQPHAHEFFLAIKSKIRTYSALLVGEYQSLDLTDANSYFRSYLMPTRTIPRSGMNLHGIIGQSYNSARPLTDPDHHALAPAEHACPI